MEIIIRPEEKKDFKAVEELTREAFWNLYRPGCAEHYLVHTMRSHSDFIPELAFVAELENRIVGSILYTKSTVVNEQGEKIEIPTFGPLCVHPDCQRVGIGTKLIEHTKLLVAAMGYPAIIIMGDPHNYCKHGFRTGKDCGIAFRDGNYLLCLLVLELQKGIFEEHSWLFYESSVFDMDQSKADEYDKQFPFKKRDYHYSQDLFSMLSRACIV